MPKFFWKETTQMFSIEACGSFMTFLAVGLDFIGEIHPASSGQHMWILTATDYFTKWI
jgi:hypothetical protein